MPDKKVHARVLPRYSLFAMLLLLPILFLEGGSGTVRAAAPLPPVTAPAANANSILVLRVYYQNDDQRKRLAGEFGAETIYTGEYFLLWADQVTLTDLRGRGLRVEIDADATRQANEPVLFGHNADTFYGGYYTVEEMQAFLDAKVAANPTLAEKVDFGDSWCKTNPTACTHPNVNSGYDLYAMHITNRSIPGPKPVFWYNAGLHSREIVAPELAMLYISWLLDNYNTNADARWLVDYQDIWIVPMSNPDGHHIVESGTPQPYTQRKNANNTNGCTTWPPGGGGQYGTDLNRNFIFMWNCCSGSSGVPCNLTYRGASPVSESETRAISNTIASLIPDQRGPGINDPAPLLTTGIYLDMHSAAALDLYPWGQTPDPAPNRNDLKNIAEHIGALNAGGNGYTVEQSDTLYPTDGASDDSTYGMLGAPAFTVELRSGNSFTPAYSVVNTDWNANKGMLVYMSKIARTPYLTTRGPDANSVATTPMTVTQGVSSVLMGTINYAWTANGYLQNVAAAEYYIDTPPWAGGTALPMSATDGTFDSATEQVQATVDTTALTPGRHILLVRGRGVNSYEGNQSWGPISAAFLDVLPAGGTGTPTVTPTITGTPTATATPWTPGPGCAALFGTGTTTCQSPSTYNYNFSFYNESGCQTSATGTATITFEVAETAAGPFSTYDTQTMQVTFPPGPSYVGFTGTFTETNIPAQYTAYRITFNASQVRLLAYATTPPNTICGTGGGTVTVTPFITATPVVTVTPTGTGSPVATIISTVTTTPTACAIQFSDVPEGSTFYPFIRCLACNGIVSGYPDNTFRPNNNVTRGQLSKIVSNSAGYNDPAGVQLFEDVPPGSTFYDFVQRLASRNIMSGYPCGSPGEPCGSGNLPYFRPNSNASRGQISKIVSNAAGYNDPAGAQAFEDVAPGSTFYDFIQRLASRNIMTGYPCGGVGEPCGSGNIPYFRPGANATRGQTSKIVANTFFQGCNPPAKR
ncbi:MAG: M14 family zinc carboxypeptidase [Chloroflexota bacterium]